MPKPLEMRCLEPGWMMRPPFTGAPFDKRSAWLWILEAAHPETGTLDLSIRDMASVLGWSKDRTARFLRELVDHNLIATASATGSTLITVCNYDRNMARPWIGATPTATTSKPKKKAAKRGKHALPDDFTITDEMKEWADEKAFGCDIEYETERFCAYYRARDTRFVRWQQAWRNWMLIAVKNPNPCKAKSGHATGAGSATDERRAALTLAVSNHRRSRTG